jgi:hypothetical protein
MEEAQGLRVERFFASSCGALPVGECTCTFGGLIMLAAEATGEVLVAAGVERTEPICHGQILPASGVSDWLEEYKRRPVTLP